MFRAAWPCSHTGELRRQTEFNIGGVFGSRQRVLYTASCDSTYSGIQQHNAFMVGVVANVMRAQPTEAGLHVPMFVFYVHVVLATREGWYM